MFYRVSVNNFELTSKLFIFLLNPTMWAGNFPNASICWKQIKVLVDSIVFPENRHQVKNKIWTSARFFLGKEACLFCGNTTIMWPERDVISRKFIQILWRWKFVNRKRSQWLKLETAYSICCICPDYVPNIILCFSELTFLLLFSFSSQNSDFILLYFDFLFLI